MLLDKGLLESEENILDGDKLRHKLESALPQARSRITFISAYVTQSAIDWLSEFKPKNVDAYIVCRLLPSDVLNGATQLSALIVALNKNIKVLCLHSLHAKIFAIDNEVIYVGSANLTNNGLKIYGTGNLEACIKVPGNNLNLRFIQNILDSATSLDEESIRNMQDYIDSKATAISHDQWPEGVIKENEGIWVRDFFWTQSEKNNNSHELSHDLELLGLGSIDNIQDILKENVLKTRCIKWLIKKLETEPGNELYFGSLSNILHNELKDDPVPYRKDVKSLLHNLLSYAEVYLPEIFEISTPRHSQKIRLMKQPIEFS